MSMKYNWMSDSQKECYDYLCQIYLGEHNLPHYKIINYSTNGIAIKVRDNWLSTFDSNHLTRMVFLAHDKCIRLEIKGSDPGMIKIVLHKRFSRDGSMSKRHPTLEQAISEWRAKEGVLNSEVKDE